MREKIKGKGFHKALMVMDAFEPHTTEDVAAAVLIGHTGVVKVPAECTSKVKPLDVSIDQPFKSVLRQPQPQNNFRILPFCYCEKMHWSRGSSLSNSGKITSLLR